MSKLLSTHLSTQTIHFKPGAAPQSFEVAVSNLSPQFATFQIELTASGIDPQNQPDWYQLAPELSSKIPAGDRTQFSITIFDVPPVPGGFVGTMTLTVRVFSLELREEDRQVVNLIIEGTGSLPPTVYLPTLDLQGNPGEVVELPVRLQNPNRNTANARITLTGLPPDWIVDGHSRRLTLAGQGESNLLFLCQLPSSSEALSRVYPFTVEAQFSSAAVTRVPAQLTVQPSGMIESTLELLNSDDWSLTYGLTINNQSNVDQQISVQMVRRLRLPWWQRFKDAMPSARTSILDPKPVHWQITPDPLPVRAGDTQTLTLKFCPKRSWVGWRQSQRYSLTPDLSQPENIELQPLIHRVPVRVLPRLPIWVQLLTVSAVAALVMIPWLWRVRHHGPVNTVMFDGQAQEVLSGSDDHTLRRWRVKGRHLRAAGRLPDVGKSIRVVRYRSVNNNWAAAGLENGEVKLWNLLTETPIATLLYQKDDRVFDLRFSRDALSLYSAHGSGAVLAWDLANLETVTQPRQQQQVDFAIQSLALVGSAGQYLALAGRFNQLALWDLAQDKLVLVNHPRGEQTDYIVGLATAEQYPTRLAMADNQGNLILWELKNCFTTGQCKQLDQWSHSQQGAAVRSIAWSADGCYLASGGEDGQIKLWQLDTSGRVIGGETIARRTKPINALDIVHLKQTVLITSGGDDDAVRLNRLKDDHPSCRGEN